MSRHDCARCDWTPDQDGEQHQQQQLADHAASAGHWLCSACCRSLTDEQRDWFGCETCLSSARTLLSGIHTMWTDLPRHLGHVRSATFDSDRPSAADGRPLPGGDALVLLGPGGTGRSEDGLTYRAEDSPSVAFTLMTIEDDWRHTRCDSASELHGSTARVVAASVKYLDTFTRWAAQHHEAFAEYLSDLRDLHGRLERATSQHEHVVRSEVECLDCGARLVREDTATGLADHYSCSRPSCGRTYNTNEFALAALDAERENLREHWVTPEQAATILRVPAETIRTWVKRDQVAKDKNRDGQTVVWFDEVETRRMQQEAS